MGSNKNRNVFDNYNSLAFTMYMDMDLLSKVSDSVPGLIRAHKLSEDLALITDEELISSVQEINNKVSTLSSRMRKAHLAEYKFRKLG